MSPDTPLYPHRQEASMTIRDLVAARFEEDSLTPSIEWLTFPGGTEKRETASWQELLNQASRVAETVGVGSQDGRERVAIMLPTSRAYWVAFIACALAGVIAVPLFEPTLDRTDHRRINSMLESCQPRVILTNSASLSVISEYVGSQTRVLDVDALMGSPEDEAPIEHWLAASGPGPDDVAYLQYTSGSTSRPSGVEITYAAFEFNLKQSCDSLGITRENRAVTWLPLYHDMGLVFALGLGIVTGIPVTMMSPDSFLCSPSRWIRALDRTEATISASPNFGYEYTLQQGLGGVCENLDLSRVQWLLSGSEPVRPSTVTRFEAELARYGLPSGSIRPSYGMAEATVFVSAAPHLETRMISRQRLTNGFVADPKDEDDSTELVSCGRIAEGTDHVVVDPVTFAVLPSGRVGELWLRGQSITRGYWGDKIHTEQTIVELPGHDLHERWLRTGDLVAVCDESLYVVGRLKSMLIIDGRNHYSEDLERTVQQVDPRIRPGRVAVVAHDTGSTEIPLIIAEIRTRTDADIKELSKRIRSAVSVNHGFASSIVALVPPDFIPLTTSGKIQRPLAYAKWCADWAD